VKGLKTCKSSHKFEVWKWGKKADGAPKVRPAFQPKSRSVTPNNRLVGAIVVSQKRNELEQCEINRHATKNKRANEAVNAFSGDELSKCLSSKSSDKPFG